MSKPLFQTKGFTLSVPSRVLVHNLNWEVKPGERWCVIGKNGAGKSTLLRSIAGVQDLLNHYGAIQWEGQDIALMDPEHLAKLRAYAEQVPSGALGMRAIDFVYAGLWAANEPMNQALALAYLDRCDVEHLAFSDWQTLSGGEQQRVALAACFAQQSPVLILDEPTSHLDVGHQIQLLKTLIEISQETPTAVIASLHDITLIQRGFTHALLLTGSDTSHGSYLLGTVEEVVTAEHLTQALGHPVVAATTPSGARVFIPA